MFDSEHGHLFVASKASRVAIEQAGLRFPDVALDDLLRAQRAVRVRAWDAVVHDDVAH